MEAIIVESILLQNSVTKGSYRGLYDESNFPLKLGNDKFFVILIRSFLGEVGHYVSFINLRNKLLFIDSMAEDVDFYGDRIQKFYNNFVGNKSIMYKSAVQSRSSLSCGPHIIFTIYNLLLGKSYTYIYNKYTSNKRRNDNMVENFTFSLSGYKNNCSRKLCPKLTFERETCKMRCRCLKNIV